jgi:hypothetical protein
MAGDARPGAVSGISLLNTAAAANIRRSGKNIQAKG